MSGKKSTYSPRGGQGVNFFSHFPRQRLKPYGEIKEPTSDTTMLEKASRLNCEYLVRPAVALSEMADTVSSNVTTLKEVLTNCSQTKIIQEVEKLDKVAKMFNTRSDLAVTSSDVHRLLKYTIDNDDEESDQPFDEMEHLSMLLYVIGCHQKQLRALVRNPAEYSKKCEDLPVKHEFKINGNLKSLKNWWASETVTSQSKASHITASYKKNLLAELGSDTDSDDDSTKQQKKKNKKRSDRQLSPSSSSVTLSDDEPAPKKKRGQKKKRPDLELSEEELRDMPGPSGEAVWSPKRQEPKRDAGSSKSKKKSKKMKKKSD